MLWQKSQFKWIRDGDANSRFLNSLMKQRFKRNGIVLLKIPRGLISQVEEIEDETKNHFEDRFREPLRRRHALVVTPYLPPKHNS